MTSVSAFICISVVSSCLKWNDICVLCVRETFMRAHSVSQLNETCHILYLRQITQILFQVHGAGQVIRITVGRQCYKHEIHAQH